MGKSWREEHGAINKMNNTKTTYTLPPLSNTIDFLNISTHLLFYLYKKKKKTTTATAMVKRQRYCYQGWFFSFFFKKKNKAKMKIRCLNVYKECK